MRKVKPLNDFIFKKIFGEKGNNDKTGIIDMRARTAKGENVDIEVQLTNQGNMDKRTLFYWGKMYLENIKQGEDYTSLEKVITINILDFDYLKTESYQSSFHL